MKKLSGSFSECKESADQFYRVAEWCRDRDAVAFLYETIYPHAVNIALACELYLKAIMIKRSPTDEFDMGHDLFALYSNLDVTDKSILETEFAKKYSELSLIDFVNENRDVFITWRYALEKSVRVNHDGFVAFAEVLNKFVDELEKGTR